MKKRLIYCFLGVLILGFGVAVCRTWQIGIDPCAAMNSGFALFLGSSLGTVMMIFQIILLILVFVFNKSYIGPGTFINGLLLGYINDMFTAVFKKLFHIPSAPSLILQIPFAVAGIIFITLGLSLYFTGALGLSPYDALGKIIHEKSHMPYAVCRIITDVICGALAILFHGPIGFGTIIIAFFTGPLIQFWNRHFSEPLFHGTLFSHSMSLSE